MRITQCDGQFLMALSAQEASRLMDACAVVVLAADAEPAVVLPTEMTSLLADLLEGLRTPAAASRQATGHLPGPDEAGDP